MPEATNKGEDTVTIKVAASANEMLERALAEYNEQASMRLYKGSVVALMIKHFARMTVEERRKMVFALESAPDGVS